MSLINSHNEQSSGVFVFTSQDIHNPMSYGNNNFALHIRNGNIPMKIPVLYSGPTGMLLRNRDQLDYLFRQIGLMNHNMQILKKILFEVKLLPKSEVPSAIEFFHDNNLSATVMDKFNVVLAEEGRDNAIKLIHSKPTLKIAVFRQYHGIPVEDITEQVRKEVTSYTTYMANKNAQK